MPAKKVTLREVKENVYKVCNEVQRTVPSVNRGASIYQEKQLVQRVVYQNSLFLKCKGMKRLIDKINSINPLLLTKFNF